MDKHSGDGAYLASHALGSIKCALVLAGAFLIIVSLPLAALIVWAAGWF